MIDIDELKRLNERATPAPWGIHADQPSVMITRKDGERIADVDTWTGKGCLDADLIIFLRNHAHEIIQLLDVPKELWQMDEDDAPEERGQTYEELLDMYSDNKKP